MQKPGLYCFHPFQARTSWLRCCRYGGRGGESPAFSNTYSVLLPLPESAHPDQLLHFGPK